MPLLDAVRSGPSAKLVCAVSRRRADHQRRLFASQLQSPAVAVVNARVLCAHIERALFSPNEVESSPSKSSLTLKEYEHASFEPASALGRVHRWAGNGNQLLQFAQC